MCLESLIPRSFMSELPMQDLFDHDLPFDKKAVEHAIEQDLAAATPENLVNGAFLTAYRAWVDKGEATTKTPEELLAENGVPLRSFGLSMTSFMLRDLFVAEFGYAVPTIAFTELLAGFGPIIEVGAGRGYLSQVLRHAGIDAIATDADPDFMKATGSRIALDKIGEMPDHALPVAVMTAEQAIDAHPGRTVLCSWPNYQSDWIARAAERLSSGQALVVIGEGNGGCTGEEGLYDLAENGILEIDRSQIELQSKAIWSFPAIHDHLQIFRKI